MVYGLTKLQRQTEFWKTKRNYIRENTSSLDFRLNQINPLCYSSGTWRV